MRVKIFIYLMLLFFSMCTAEKTPSKYEYIGKYAIYSNSSYLLDTLSVHNNYSKRHDSLSTNYYYAHEAQLDNSYLIINTDGTFFIKSNVLNDSIGTWDMDYNNDYGSFLNMKFTNVNSGAMLYYDKDGFRILDLHTSLFKEKQVLEKKGAIGIKLIYKKVGSGSN